MTEGGARKLIRGLVKLRQFSVIFIALWSQNESFQTLQSCHFLRGLPSCNPKGKWWIKMSERLELAHPTAAGADPASMVKEGERFSNSQVSVRVHYCKRDEVYFTTLLWQNSWGQNGLISGMLFSKLLKIMVNKVTFESFWWGYRPPRIRPCIPVV